MDYLKIIEVQSAEIEKLQKQLKCLLNLIHELTQEQQKDVVKIYLNQKISRN